MTTYYLTSIYGPTGPAGPQGVVGERGPTGFLSTSDDVQVSTLSCADIAVSGDLVVAGSVDKTTRLCGRYIGNALSIGNGAYSTVTWDSEDARFVNGTTTLSYSGGLFTNTTAVSRVYFVTVSVTWGSSTAGRRILRLLVNTTNNESYHYGQEMEIPVSTLSQTSQVSGVVVLHAGEYFKCVVYQSSGGALMLGGNNNSKIVVAEI